MLLGNSKEIEKEIKFAQFLNNKYFLMPLLIENHTSLLIFSPTRMKLYHVDSKMNDKNHLRLIKYKLADFLDNFHKLYDSDKKRFDTHTDRFWDSIKVI
jgi:hypothetical protein